MKGKVTGTERVLVPVDDCEPLEQLRSELTRLERSRQLVR